MAPVVVDNNLDSEGVYDPSTRMVYVNLDRIHRRLTKQSVAGDRESVISKIRQVVLHEFAHLIDDAMGGLDGEFRRVADLANAAGHSAQLGRYISAAKAAFADRRPGGLTDEQALHEVYADIKAFNLGVARAEGDYVGSKYISDPDQAFEAWLLSALEHEH